MRKLYKTSPAKDFALGPSPVFSATIVSVDIDSYTMKVKSKYFAGLTKRIDIPCLFFNVRDASGAIAGVLPEVGAEVWLCKVADAEDEYFPISYRGIIGDNSYKGARPTGMPGDVILSTSDGNYLHVSKGGTVSMSSSPTCSVMLSATDDTLYTLSSQVKEYTLSNSRESVCDNGRRVHTSYKYFEIAEQREPSVDIRIGNTGSLDVYSMAVNPYDSETSVTIGIQRDGHSSFVGHKTTIETEDLTVVSSLVDVTNTSLSLYTSSIEVEATTSDDGSFSGDIHVSSNDAHVEPSLLTVGSKLQSDFLLKNNLLTTDLDILLSALDAHSTAVAASLSSVGFPVAATLAPVTAAIQNMKAKIASGVYATNKLKSE